jgi:hypothetical protein
MHREGRVLWRRRPPQVVARDRARVTALQEPQAHPAVIAPQVHDAPPMGSTERSVASRFSKAPAALERA